MQRTESRQSPELLCLERLPKCKQLSITLTNHTATGSKHDMTAVTKSEKVAKGIALSLSLTVKEIGGVITLP